MGRTNKMRISVISIILGILLIAFIGVATIVTNNQSQIAFAEPHDHSGWTAWDQSDSLPTVAGNYYLDVDVTLNPWCTDLLERHVQTYGDVTINVEYDDCNPFAMVAGDFGDMADLSLHTEQTASVSTLNYLNTLSERFNTFIGGYTIPKNGSSYVQNTNSDYANFYTSARSVYSTSVAQNISWSSDYSTYSAVIGANYPYVLKGDNVPSDLDYQLLLAKLFGFSDKTAFMDCAQALADACAAYTLSPTNEALMNGCFYSNGNYIFPITSRNGVVSPVRMFVFVDANGYVSVWVDYIQNALKAVNFNADYYQSYYSTVDQGVIYNRLYCKNVLFITGSAASWKVPDGTKLCLNGHSITYQSFLRDGGTYASVIDASGSTFDLYDCDETVHYYYVDADQNGGGCGVVVDSEEAAIEGNPDKYGSFKGGYITGGTGTKHSRDNINSYYKGGAIFGDGTGTNVTMHGGTLIGNSGGLYTFDESGAVHVSRGTFRMTGGNIIGNLGTAVNVEGPKNTSGTYCYLEGGLIRHNSGGVLAHGQYQSEGYGDASLYIGGPIEIYDNFTRFQDYETGIWYRQENGITLGWGAMIRVDNPLQNEHPIPVSGAYGQFTYGLQGNGGAENFTSTGGYLVTLTNDGEAQFVEACYVTYNANGATSGTAPVDNNVYLPGDKVTILGQGNLAKSGHTFGGWRISEWDETIYTEGQEITISYSMNFSAIWEHQPHDDVNFQTKWTAYDSLPTEAGNYYLVMPVQLNNTWTVPEGTTNLCLHGYDIIMQSYEGGPVIIVPTGSTLNIYDCESTQKLIYIENWRGQYASMGEEGLNDSGYGYIKVYGGSITGGYADAGAGIWVSGGTVNMYGGNIVGNKANDKAGGVYVESGSFAMHGGKIAANKANNSGAGVFVDENGAMSLSGNVTISGNTTGYSDSNVYLSADKVITITGALTYETPISVKLVSGRAVFTSGWSTYMSEEDPADFFTGEDDTCEIILFENEAKVYKEAHEHNGVEFEEWTSDYSLPASGNYYLTKDVTISSTTTVTGTLNLCLNGHGIKMTGSGSVFSVSSGKTLNVYDNTTTVHRFTVSNPKPNGAGVATVNDALTEGYQTFEGGYITGGTGGDGAGIRVYGTFNLYGGNVIGNNGTSGDANGGAIKMENGSAFTMYGGNVIYNHGRTGGALFVESNSVFTMMGGTIGYNVNSVRGAAFFTRGTVYIRGGEISNNYNNGEQAIALWGGTIEITGGVLSDNLNNASGLMTLSALSLGGNAVIKDNKDGSGNQANLYVKNGGVISIVGALDDSVKNNKIGVTLQSGAGVFASGWSTYMSGKDPADYFYSENGGYAIGVNASGEVLFGDTFEVSFVANGHGVAPDGQSVVEGCLVQEPAALTDDVYTFAGWYKEEACTNEWAFAVDTVSADTTLYAKWTFVYSNVTFEAWTSTNSLPADGNYYLTDNVTVSVQTVVPSGNVVHLCLNGHSVTNTVSRIYLVNDGGILHVYDNVGSGSMRGEKLNNNYDSSIGTVVRVAKGGYFELHSGTLYGSPTPGKGYFTVLTNGEFTMSGGMITEEQDQFGVQAEGADSVFRMTGGVITNCKGGGVHVYGGTAYISGGTISDNGEARAFGGVLLLSDYASSALFLSGNPTIANNTNNQGVACNVNLYGTKTITIDGALTNTTPIGVTRASGVFASDWSTYMDGEDPADYFTSDNDTYAIGLVNGEATVLLSMTVTAQGYEGDYDGDAHGITVTPSATGATVKYGTAADACTLDTITYTDAGTYTVYYEVTKTGYASAKGSATVTISAINVTVTITGNTVTADYDGEEHTASGYEIAFGNALYTANDFAFDGTATASRTNAGTAYMGLEASQFANTNGNFATVTFTVTDGYVTVLTVDAVVSKAPQTVDPVYDGEEKVLISAGEVVGGTLYYALGDSTGALDESYELDIPTATEIGNYYVWYKVVANDNNHKDLAPAFVKVTIAEPAWVTLSGTVSDEAAAVGGVVVKLMKGNKTVDLVTTDADGNYRFIVPVGVYNVVIEYNDHTETTIVALFEDTEKDVVLSGTKTESKLEVKTEEEEDLGITVGGLEEEAQAIREENPTAETVSVVMTVEYKSEEQIEEEPEEAPAKNIQNSAQEKNLEFYEIKVEKTVDQATTILEETANILEIAIPYAKAHKRGLIVYSYHDDSVRTFTESDTKADGTFRVDKANKLIYVYANKFSTYAVGYTPYYRVQTALSLGSYAGKASVTIVNDADANITFTLNDVNANNIVFPDVPKGQYTMTVTWKDGKTNVLTMTLTVGPKTVLSVKTEPEGPEEEQEEPANAACIDMPEETEFVANDEEESTAVIMGAGYEPVVPDVAITEEDRKKSDETRALPRKRDDDNE